LTQEVIDTALIIATKNNDLQKVKLFIDLGSGHPGYIRQL